MIQPFNITDYVKSQNNKTLVDLWNASNPEAQIKKFADRETAIRRMTLKMGDYATFYSKHAEACRSIGITLPPLPVKAAPAPPPKPPAPIPPGGIPREKQKSSPHYNLRCLHCNYYAKTTPEMLAKARLTCPVDAKHGNLLTPKERGERRGG